MKFEVKSIGVKSMFKTIIYFTSIPVLIMFIIGTFVALIGILSGNSNVIVAVIPFLVMPFIMLGIYGVMGMLAAVIYNLFSYKFGGLELTMIEKVEMMPYRQDHF